MSTPRLDPIVHEYHLACDPAEAFAVYTERISDWWHPDYTASPETLQSVVLEPEVGGRLYATHSDLGEDVWGEVTEWDPGRRASHSFTLAQDPAHPTQVSVDFERARPTGTTMRFSHAGWTAANAEARRKFGDWPVMLDRMKALAERSY